MLCINRDLKPNIELRGLRGTFAIFVIQNKLAECLGNFATEYAEKTQRSQRFYWDFVLCFKVVFCSKVKIVLTEI